MMMGQRTNRLHFFYVTDLHVINPVKRLMLLFLIVIIVIFAIFT